MYAYSLLSFAFLAASAFDMDDDWDAWLEDLRVCDDKDPAVWLPETSTGVENPEAAGACDSDDAANDFQDCECVPARTVKWDTDPDMMTDMTPLNKTQIKNKQLQNDKFHMIFNSREYQALSHETKMEMLWDQLTKVKKVKCQDWEKIWKNFLQNPNHSMKKVTHSEDRLSGWYRRNQLKREQERKGFGDEMHREITEGKVNPRQKYVHQQGVVTKGKFVVTKRNRGYTGIFASGADDVIMRFSEAGQHFEGKTKSLNPSIALKFLRSKVTSANTFGMLSFEPEEDGKWDFWREDFRSHLPNFANAHQDEEPSVCYS